MLLSVIIPVYNAEATIVRAVESVIRALAEVTDDYEIICVNDGSTDGSLAALRRLAGGNGKIAVVDQANQGAGAARNAGLERCRGEFIAFNDADDVWMPGMLKERLAVLSVFPDAACVAANHDVDRQWLPFLRKVRGDVYKITLKAQLFKNYFSPPKLPAAAARYR
jgi:glycosyltransferase involved in cell wall biosynthesis